MTAMFTIQGDNLSRHATHDLHTTVDSQSHTLLPVELIHNIMRFLRDKAWKKTSPDSFGFEKHWTSISAHSTPSTSPGLLSSDGDFNEPSPLPGPGLMDHDVTLGSLVPYLRSLSLRRPRERRDSSSYDHELQTQAQSLSDATDTLHVRLLAQDDS
jgi:hypothetical protein